MERLKKRNNKSGLSPIIATSLLISLALVLVTTILLWAKTWTGERIEKNLGAGPEAIENFCDDISFSVEAELTGEGKVNVNNIGNIILYGMEVRKRGAGTVENIGIGVFDNGLAKGAGKSVSIDFGSGVNVGDELIIVPIILGETEKYKKPYTCDEKFGQIVRVI